jgi:hypothetical protein
MISAIQSTTAHLVKCGLSLVVPVVIRNIVISRISKIKFTTQPFRWNAALVGVPSALLLKKLTGCSWKTSLIASAFYSVLLTVGARSRSSRDMARPQLPINRDMTRPQVHQTEFQAGTLPQEVSPFRNYITGRGHGVNLAEKVFIRNTLNEILIGYDYPYKLYNFYCSHWSGGTRSGENELPFDRYFRRITYAFDEDQEKAKRLLRGVARPISFIDYRIDGERFLDFFLKQIAQLNPRKNRDVRFAELCENQTKFVFERVSSLLELKFKKVSRFILPFYGRYDEPLAIEKNEQGVRLLILNPSHGQIITLDLIESSVSVYRNVWILVARLDEITKSERPIFGSFIDIFERILDRSQALPLRLYNDVINLTNIHLSLNTIGPNSTLVFEKYNGFSNKKTKPDEKLSCTRINHDNFSIKYKPYRSKPVECMITYDNQDKDWVLILNETKYKMTDLLSPKFEFVEPVPLDVKIAKMIHVVVAYLTSVYTLVFDIDNKPYDLHGYAISPERLKVIAELNKHTYIGDCLSVNEEGAVCFLQAPVHFNEEKLPEV